MLREAFGTRARAHLPLAPFTTFRVGGPAQWLIETRNTDEIVVAMALAERAGVSVTILGGGSNVLIADAGIRGLVIRPRGGTISSIDDRSVRADAAVTINGLVRWTVTHACAGLEAWAGTPGTVGGAVFGNAHFGGRLIGDLVWEVGLAGRFSAAPHDGAPVACVSKTHAAARDAERRLCISEPAAGARRGAGRDG